MPRYAKKRLRAALQWKGRRSRHYQIICEEMNDSRLWNRLARFDLLDPACRTHEFKDLQPLFIGLHLGVPPWWDEFSLSPAQADRWFLEGWNTPILPPGREDRP